MSECSIYPSCIRNFYTKLLGLPCSCGVDHEKCQEIYIIQLTSFGVDLKENILDKMKRSMPLLPCLSHARIPLAIRHFHTGRNSTKNDRPDNHDNSCTGVDPAWHPTWTHEPSSCNPHPEVCISFANMHFHSMIHN